jgi:PKD repeat protein
MKQTCILFTQEDENGNSVHRSSFIVYRFLRMKNKIRFVVALFIAVFLLAACAPQEFDDYQLGNIGTISTDQITFTYAKSAKSDNILIFTNTSNIPIPYSYTWNLGNGTTTKEQSPTGVYPNAGNYDVSLTVSSADGSTLTKTQTIVIANDDASLLDTENYRNLTGGPSNTAGKTWVFDRYNLYVGEVAKETGKNIGGFMGLGPENSFGQSWWAAGPDEKSYDKVGWRLYDFEFNFNQNGLNLHIANAGFGYGRNACLSLGGFSATEVQGEDAVFNYAGGNYSFSLSEDGEYPQLTLSGNAFLGYYAGTQTYDILYLTEEVLAVRVHNTVEGQDWIFVFIREDLNVAEPPIIKTPKAIPLFENFEGSEPSVPFAFEDMGTRTSASYQNPAPVPVNESAKVFLYEKSEAFYSNISYTTTDYLFDLTDQNKIKIKVFIPGYNDYVTEGTVAGDWITNKKLLRKIAVKLQDSSKGGNAWETQTEIVKTDLELDKWLDLEFDFSQVANRTDYDKIVIQFGDEGHSRSGIFFFDDFSFGK